MTDDLTKAYSSIYNKEEESKPEQVQEVIGAVLGAATALNAVNNVRKAITKKPKTTTTTTTEDVALTHLDGSTTEIVDVVKPEALGEPDEKLASRLWDQVAANLDTLGEMYGASFDVVELEEKMADKDYDGDGKVESSTDEYMGSRDKAIKKAMAMKKEGFNVKSPVIFSKPEEKVEETISEEIIEKHASSISRAHKAIKK